MSDKNAVAKTRKIIQSNYRSEFLALVNSLLEIGWSVSPGTFQELILREGTEMRSEAKSFFIEMQKPIEKTAEA